MMKEIVRFIFEIEERVKEFSQNSDISLYEQIISMIDATKVTDFSNYVTSNFGQIRKIVCELCNEFENQNPSPLAVEVFSSFLGQVVNQPELGERELFVITYYLFSWDSFFSSELAEVFALSDESDALHATLEEKFQKLSKEQKEIYINEVKLHTA